MAGGHRTIDQSSIDVKSVADGEVVDVCDEAGDFVANSRCDINGNYVRVKYALQDGPILMQYGHLALGSVAVNVGDKVSSGQVLGKMGQTGLATGIHTHFHLYNSYIGDNNLDFRVVFGVNQYKRCAGHGRRHRLRAFDFDD